MPKLTRDQELYVKNRIAAKRMAAMNNFFHYRITKNLFLVECKGVWTLFNDPDFKMRIEDVDILDVLIKNIAEFKKASDEDEAFKNIKLEHLLRLSEIQYILLRAEEKIQSQLLLPEAERKKIDETKNLEDALQLLKKRSDLERYGSSDASSASRASSCQPALSVQFTRYQPYRTYDFKLQNNSDLMMNYKADRKKTQEFLRSPDDILSKFKNHYPKQSRFASLFVRNALAKAVDPRPWYQRWFTTAPLQTSKAEQIRYLLNHANTDPFSNTAKTFVAILDNEVENKDITDIDDVIRSAEAAAPRVLKKNRAGEYCFFEKNKSPKADSPTRSMSGSLTPSGAALPAAAACSELDLSVSIRGRRQRSGSQDSGVSALIRSAGSGSFPPSLDSASRRQEKPNVDKAGSTLSPASL